MDELIAELRRLGATIKYEWQSLYVNGTTVPVETKTKDGKVTYDVGWGKKKSSSVKNVAYYILTELLPEYKRKEAMAAMVKDMSAGFPPLKDGGADVWCMGSSVRVDPKDTDQLRAVIRHMAEHFDNLTQYENPPITEE
jgi:hypothetical protein